MGVTGEMAAEMATAVPCVIVAGFTAMVVVLGRVPAVRVSEAAAETDAW
jgi:hypothetical protein